MDWKKKKRNSETPGSITKDLTFVSMESQKETRKRVKLRSFQKNIAPQTPQFGKKHKHTDSGN